jgi:predicted RNA-binding protein with PUA domain
MSSLVYLMNQAMDLTPNWFVQRMSLGVSIDERDRHADTGAQVTFIHHPQDLRQAFPPSIEVLNEDFVKENIRLPGLRFGVK